MHKRGSVIEGKSAGRKQAIVQKSRAGPMTANHKHRRLFPCPHSRFDLPRSPTSQPIDLCFSQQAFTSFHNSNITHLSIKVYKDTCVYAIGKKRAREVHAREKNKGSPNRSLQGKEPRRGCQRGYETKAD